MCAQGRGTGTYSGGQGEGVGRVSPQAKVRDEAASAGQWMGRGPETTQDVRGGLCLREKQIFPRLGRGRKPAHVPFPYLYSPPPLPPSTPLREYDVEPGQSRDQAYYEGHYPSGQQQGAGVSGGRRGAPPSTAPAVPGGGSGSATAALSSAELDARNPLRQAYRRAPGIGGRRPAGQEDEIMRPR